MEQLFAPWRIEWVTRESSEDGGGCVFCELPDREDHRDALVVAESEGGYILLNNYPYNPGHALIIPRRHVETYGDLTGDELLTVGRLVQRTIDALETAMDVDGINVGYNLGEGAGGSIDHVHAHVVPRWSEDTNFMAVVAETKVIVQALEDTYDELHAAFAAQEGATNRDSTHAVRLDV